MTKADHCRHASTDIAVSLALLMLDTVPSIPVDFCLLRLQVRHFLKAGRASSQLLRLGMILKALGSLPVV